MAHGANRFWIVAAICSAAVIAGVVALTQFASKPPMPLQTHPESEFSKDTPTKVAAPAAASQAAPRKKVETSKREAYRPEVLQGQEETALERARRLKLSEIIFSDVTKYKAKFLDEDKYLVPYEHVTERFRSCVSDINPQKVCKGRFEGTTFRYIFPGAWRDNYGDGFSAAWCHMFDALGLQLDENQRDAISSLVWYVYDEGGSWCKEIEASVIDPNERFGDSSWDVAWELQVEAYQELYWLFLGEVKNILTDGQFMKLGEFLRVCQLRQAEL